MIFAILGATALALGLLCATIRNQWGKRQFAEILLLAVFLVPVGLGGPVGFVGHTLRAAEIAASIGWPAGNPFQHQIRSGQPFAPGNAGAVLYFDIFMPVFVLALLRIRGAR